LDGKVYPTFPLASSGNQIAFNYQALTCQTKHLNQFIDLLNDINVQSLTITNNSLCFGAWFNENNNDKLVVDVKANRTIINLYDHEGIIKKMITVNEGVNSIASELQNLVKVPNNENF
jgi:cell division ATPase FtsA